MGEGVGCQVSVSAFLDLSTLREVAEEDADAIDLFVAIVALLEGAENIDARTAILNDAVDHGKSPFDELAITADSVHNEKERLEKLLYLWLLAAVIKECALVVVAQLNELSDKVL